MQFLFEFIVQAVFGGLGALIKKLFGRPRSESGISEMWIGASIVVAVLIVAIVVAR